MGYAKLKTFQDAHKKNFNSSPKQEKSCSNSTIQLFSPHQCTAIIIWNQVDFLSFFLFQIHSAYCQEKIQTQGRQRAILLRSMKMLAIPESYLSITSVLLFLIRDY